MKILFTGKGSSGSWKIRGEQLGNAVGEAIPNAPIEKIKEADLIVWVKRPTKLLDEIIKLKKPWVWDLVDFYPQPECSNWGKDKTIFWVRDQIRRYAPNGIIYANKKMAHDINLPGFTLYHHHWPEAKPIKVREHIKTVGYQGCSKYLGFWEQTIRNYCDFNEWDFLINPPCLSDLDVVVAFRAGQYNGYAQRNWKSNVKITNAHAYGLPFIALSEPGYREVAHDHDQFVSNELELIAAFNNLTYKRRQLCNALGQVYKIDLDTCAYDLERYICSIL